MRKLPSDQDVAMLKRCGWTVREIADRYGVSACPVYEALKRWDSRPSKNEEVKALHDDRNFTRAGAQAVNHRDTGEGLGFGRAVPVGRVYRTTLADCSDLLREWGVQ